LLHHALLGFDATAAAHGFEHLSHLGVLAEEVVDLLDGGTGAAGDALAAASVDEFVVAALAGGHGVDDGLDAVELLLVHVLGGLRHAGEGADRGEHLEDRLHGAHLFNLTELLAEVVEGEAFAGMAQAAENVDEKQFNRIETIIDSMTARERRDHELINGSRRKRIARGSGTSVQEVNNLLRQYAQMRKMFKSMGSGGTGLKAQQRMMQQMQPKQRFGR
jgi:hypothetical protein